MGTSFKVEHIENLTIDNEESSGWIIPEERLLQATASFKIYPRERVEDVFYGNLTAMWLYFLAFSTKISKNENFAILFGSMLLQVIKEGDYGK